MKTACKLVFPLILGLAWMTGLPAVGSGQTPAVDVGLNPGDTVELVILNSNSAFCR